MSKNEIKDIAKKIAYTGIGAIAVAAEAAGGVVEKLAEKGEKVATDSKVINEGKKAVKDFKENVSKSKAKKVMDAVVDLTKEEREALRKKLDEFEAEIEKAVGEVDGAENDQDIEVEFYNDLKSDDSCKEECNADKKEDSVDDDDEDSSSLDCGCCCDEHRER
mgnify:CR=1 FL=1